MSIYVAIYVVVVNVTTGNSSSLYVDYADEISFRNDKMLDVLFFEISYRPNV